MCGVGDPHLYRRHSADMCAERAERDPVRN